MHVFEGSEILFFEGSYLVIFARRAQVKSGTSWTTKSSSAPRFCLYLVK
jgi:hypothetical protein